MPQLYADWVDLGVALLLLGGVLIGIRQGLIRQIAFFGAVYISTVLAAQYQSLAGEFLRYFFQDSDPLIRSFAAFSLLFFAALAVLNWLSYAVYGNTRLPFLAAADSMGGAALGLLSGWVLASVTLVILNYGLRANWVDAEPISFARVQMAQSLLAPVVYSGFPLLTSALLPWLPTGLPVLFAI